METRTEVSRYNATATHDTIDRILRNYTIVNFMLDDEDILALIKIQGKCDAIPTSAHK